MFIGVSRAQESWQITCQYIISGADYDCVVISALVPDNENANITIVGLHQPGSFLNLS